LEVDIQGALRDRVSQQVIRMSNCTWTWDDGAFESRKNLWEWMSYLDERRSNSLAGGD
jgi:hypothetical protein